ncbi:MAG TPA: ABC transporter permease, partial [Usitatibacter sp.]|nr:ABC transporter permease [Usitatibacter sp.]
MSAAPALPRWADIGLLPLVNLAMALIVAGIVVAFIGQNPLDVLKLLVQGAFGSARGISYTLYYATTFIFTGLAVAVAAHGGLFNIGAEGQATLGGLGAALVALWFADSLPSVVMLPLMVVAAAAFGAAWAAIPAYLQAYRGSHIVITTIMFNFLAYTLLVYLLVNVLKAPGQMAVESAAFAPSANLPTISEVLAGLGIEWPSSPLNLSFVLALLAAGLVYVYLWHTRAGYRLRTVGSNVGAAEYAGIRPAHQ